MGSLIEGGRDLTGQLYMRNRFYDPASGRFTQEDPIGIAGGLNVYGFANGDPVSYSDPYGLCPPKDANFRNCLSQFRDWLVGSSTGETVLLIGCIMGCRGTTSRVQGAIEAAHDRYPGVGMVAAVVSPEARIEAIGSQVDNIVGHVAEREHLSTASLEAAGKLRIPRPDGNGFWDHVTETRDAMNGLRNSIGRLNRMLSESGLSDAARETAIALLSKASRALDAMETALRQ